jgi:hypothetical protein
MSGKRAKRLRKEQQQQNQKDALIIIDDVMASILKKSLALELDASGAGLSEDALDLKNEIINAMKNALKYRCITSLEELENIVMYYGTFVRRIYEVNFEVFVNEVKRLLLINYADELTLSNQLNSGMAAEYFYMFDRLTNGSASPDGTTVVGAVVNDIRKLIDDTLLQSIGPFNFENALQVLQTLDLTNHKTALHSAEQLLVESLKREVA